MTDTLYRRAKQVFLEVCDLETTLRNDQIESACNGDADLLAEVRSLLNHYHAEAGTDDSAGAWTIKADTPRPRREPTMIGSYRIIHEVGRGGMGVVYLAVREDDQFRRRVALKVLKRGMDTDDVLRRFELERQVLSALNHPNIARLYDVGETDDHRPFYVMEHIEGQAIDDYADSHRLNIGQRLILFRAVCRAVHHAHRNLIVHRDLKPSNIIVNRDGVPKLLDFGIAKIINPELSLVAGDPTAPELRVMTPEYASPEQVRGEPITTASDVYSLGVLLFEILTGHRPYRLKSRLRAEIMRVVCDEDPERPSTAISHIEEVDFGEEDESGTYHRTTRTITPESICKVREMKLDRLQKSLIGDVDNIVLKAMHKAPDRRYTSAEQFGEDIDRHLKGLPVVARPDTWAYRASKFVRRNRFGVGAAAAVVLAIAGGGAAAAAGWRSESEARAAEQEQRAIADARTAQVLGLTNTILFEFEKAVRHLEEALPARELFVSSTLVYLDELRDGIEGNDELLRLVATGLDKIGSIQGGARSGNLGDSKSALLNYRNALELREPLLLAQPENPERKHDVYLSHLHIGDALLKLGRVPEAEAPYRRALELTRELVEFDSAYERDLSVALIAMGKLSYRSGRHDEVMPYYEEALAIRKRLLRATPDSIELLRDLSKAHNSVGGQLARDGDLDGALKHYVDALDLRVRRRRLKNDDGQTKRDVSVQHLLIGQTLGNLGRTAEARSHLEQHLVTAEERANDNPTDARARRDLAIALEGFGNWLHAMGDRTSAMLHFRRFNEVAEQLVASYPGPVQHHRLLAQSHERIGDLAAAIGDRRDSIRQFRAGIDALDVVLDTGVGDASMPRRRARLLQRLGRELMLDDQPSEAVPVLREAVSMYERMYDERGSQAEVRDGYAFALEGAALLRIRLGETSRAVQQAERALQVATRRTPALVRTLALAHEADGNRAEAVSLAEEGIALLDAGASADDNSNSIRDELTAIINVRSTPQPPR